MSRGTRVGWVPPDLGPPTGREHILHVDMDAFYAAIEVRRDPRLRGRPVIVGGTGNRGVVASASYEARRHGVHSAMPTAQARRLCRDGVFLPPDFVAYQEEAVAIRGIFESVTPLVEPLSLDEAFLDVSGAHGLFGDATAIGEAIRERIRQDRRLVASVGAAATKFVAKLGSKAAKPDGLVCVPAGAEERFLHPMDVGELWGVGEATVDVLRRLGIRTVGDLATLSPSILERGLGGALGRHLHTLSHGRDDRRVEPHHEPKSIGHEETYPVDLADPDSIHAQIRSLAERVAQRLRHNGYSARTITLKCRLATFRTLTRAQTLPEPVDSGPEVHAVARSLYDRLALARPAVRLLGVSASGLVTGAPTRQLSFDAEPRWSDLMRATDAVRSRFGSDAITPATLLDTDRHGG